MTTLVCMKEEKSQPAGARVIGLSQHSVTISQITKKIILRGTRASARERVRLFQGVQQQWEVGMWDVCTLTVHRH